MNFLICLMKQTYILLRPCEVLVHLHAVLHTCLLTLTVLVVTIDAQWEGMGDVGSARYEPALLPPCPTIRVLSYSNLVNFQKFNTLRVKKISFFSSSLRYI